MTVFISRKWTVATRVVEHINVVPHGYSGTYSEFHIHS